MNSKYRYIPLIQFMFKFAIYYILCFVLTEHGFGKSVSMEHENKVGNDHVKHEDNAPRRGYIRSEEIEMETSKRM